MNRQQALSLADSPWFRVRDGDARLRPIYNRHYSSRGSAAPQIVGPGGKLVLLTPAIDALFVWRWYRDKCPLAPADGVNCAVFRNESQSLASELILAAEPFALERWPMATALYTYVDPAAITSSNPGYCFRRAGYSRAGMTAGGHGRPRLLVLVKLVR